MDKNFISNIATVIQTFNAKLETFLPQLKQEVDELIANKRTDVKEIEAYLDTLLSLTTFGVAEDVFVRLLDYYKTIDAEGARFYWNEFDKEDDR